MLGELIYLRYSRHQFSTALGLKLVPGVRGFQIFRGGWHWRIKTRVEDMFVATIKAIAVEYRGSTSITYLCQRYARPTGKWRF